MNGPFDLGGGSVVGYVHFEAAVPLLYLPPGFHAPEDQAGFEVDGAISSASVAGFWFAQSTNPGPGSSQLDGTIFVSASDPFIRTSPLTGIGWYSTADTPYAAYPLGPVSATYTVEFEDFGTPWAVTPVPEPPAWSLMLCGFVGLHLYLKRARGRSRPGGSMRARPMLSARIWE